MGSVGNGRGRWEKSDALPCAACILSHVDALISVDAHARHLMIRSIAYA